MGVDGLLCVVPAEANAFICVTSIALGAFRVPTG